jgi:hypothetical protein
VVEEEVGVAAAAVNVWVAATMLPLTTMSYQNQLISGRNTIWLNKMVNGE